MARKHQRNQASGNSIIIVDDDPNVRGSLRILLEREGHTIMEACDGPEGVKLAAEHHFDLMLLDFLMPGMTGEDVVREIRKTNTDLQILLQTGYANERPPREMLRLLDIQGYHDKSEGPEKLLIWVDAALKAARHVQSIRQSQRGLMYILSVASEIHRIQPLEDLLQGIFLQFLGFLQAKSGFVAAVGIPKVEADGFLLTMRDDQLSIPFGAGQYQQQSDFDALSPELREDVQGVLKRGEVLFSEERTLVPLVVGDRTLGVVNIEGAPPLDANMELIKIFSNQAAVAIENLQLYDAVTHDAMTGAFSKTYFLTRFQEALQLAVRHDRPLSLMMVDIDYFKRLNDSYGHQVGDQVIIEFVKAINECLRVTDLVGRYGGDEFVVLLPETAPENAEGVADRICQRIRAICLMADGAPVQLTTSIGICGFPGLGIDGWKRGVDMGFYPGLMEAVLRTADEALYQTKARGRDGYSVQNSLEIAVHGE